MVAASYPARRDSAYLSVKTNDNILKILLPCVKRNVLKQSSSASNYTSPINKQSLLHLPASITRTHFSDTPFKTPLLCKISENVDH